MIEFDEDGLPVDPAEEPRVAGTFQQRLYRALSDLADIVAVDGFFMQEQLIEIVNRWSIDPPIDPEHDQTSDGGWLMTGMDQMKLHHAINHQETDEALVEGRVLALVKAYEEAPDYENMDQIDFVILEQERDLAKDGQGVAYLTACLNQDPVSAHEIINEMGCSLTHLITGWFMMYMMRHEEAEPGTNPYDAVRKRIGIMGMENAKAAAMTPGQRRAAIEEQIETFKRATGFYDQDEDSGPDVPG